MRERAAKSNALVLEIIGDLPSADVKPPENVLFVCKLNPITQAEDLKMIFSRFGPISSCEVIKDRESGASLGYAFIEFESKESCEQAYLKMDNVLIDDRRVKVDFSQSVAKLHKQWIEKRQDKQRKESRNRNGDKGNDDDIRSRYRDNHKRFGDRDRNDNLRYHRNYDRRDYRNRDERDRRDYRDKDEKRYRSRSPSNRR